MKKMLEQMNARLERNGLAKDLTYVQLHSEINIGPKSLNAKSLNVSFWLFYHKNRTIKHNVEDHFILHGGTRLLVDIRGIIDRLEEHVRDARMDTSPITKSIFMNSIVENVSDRIVARLTCEPAFTKEYIDEGHLDEQILDREQYPFIICMAYPSYFKRHSTVILSADRVYDPKNPDRKPNTPVDQAVIEIGYASSEFSPSYPVDYDLKKYADYLHKNYSVNGSLYVHSIPIDWAACLFPKMDIPLDIKHFIFVGEEDHSIVYLDPRPKTAYIGENKILIKNSKRNTNSFIYARK